MANLDERVLNDTKVGLKKILVNTCVQNAEEVVGIINTYIPFVVAKVEQTTTTDILVSLDFGIDSILYYSVEYTKSTNEIRPLKITNVSIEIEL